VRRSLPPLKALYVFEVAARSQRFTSAAEVLNVTHGAVSKQIKLLEMSLGIPVFERRPRYLVLTPHGRQLMKSTGKALDIIEREFLKTKSEVKLRSRQHPRLVIMCDPDFAAMWLMPRLRLLRDALNGAHVEIKAVADPKQEILKERGDCAIWYGSRSYRGLNTQRLFKCVLFPVCSARLKASGTPLGSPNDLLRHTLLHDRDTREWQKYFKLAGLPQFDRDSGEIFGMSHLTLDAALQDMGVAIGDDVLCAQQLRDGTLVRPFGPSFTSPNTYFLSTNPFTKQPALILALQTWIGSETRNRKWSSAST
jgi:LysR family transcriptional regulator, glycine cleavage system transcriptional activator